MKFVNVPDELLEFLEPYSDWFYKQDLSVLNDLAKERAKEGSWPFYNNRGLTESLDYATSPEYLNYIIKKDGEHIGWPEKTYGYDLKLNENNLPQEFKDKYKTVSNELCSFLGARNQAVHNYYPKYGYMGWHNNWNAHGYNILLSYTKNGNGFFKYRTPDADKEKQEIIHMQDPGGGACKVGYYGRGREPDKVYYHSAGTLEPRITIAFIIPHLELWQNMVDDISGEIS